MRLVREAGEQDPGLSLNAAVVMIGKRTGVNADTLRGWCKQADIDAAAGRLGQRHAPEILRQSRPRSTADLPRHLRGSPSPKPSTSAYAYSRKPALLRPLNLVSMCQFATPAARRRPRWRRRLDRKRGDFHDNA